MTTATWVPSGDAVVIGSQDTKYSLAIWDLSGNLVYKFPEDGIRVNDLAISPDGSRLVVLLEARILVYDFQTREKIGEWLLDDVKLSSVSISRDCRHMLVSMIPNKVRLMEIDTGEVVQRYQGQVQTQFIIRSSFGGANESFVASGSEGMISPVFWRNDPHFHH